MHAELYSASNDGSGDLTEEHWPMRDLHVVAQLEIAREIQRLRHGNIAPCLEQHHRNRAARKGVSDDQFRDDVEPNLLVCNGLDHTNRDGIHDRLNTERILNSRRKRRTKIRQNIQIKRASTNAHTGKSVSHTSMAMTPNPNMVTEIGKYLTSEIDCTNERTEYRQVPPIRDLLVHGHEAGVDIRLFGE